MANQSPLFRGLENHARLVRRDWLTYLIGIASKLYFSPCHIVKITKRKKTFQIEDISLAVKKTVLLSCDFL